MARKVGQIIARGGRTWLVRVYLSVIAKRASAGTTTERSMVSCGKHRRTSPRRSLSAAWGAVLKAARSSFAHSRARMGYHLAGSVERTCKPVSNGLRFLNLWPRFAS
jgi:hypothetical protein